MASQTSKQPSSLPFLSCSGVRRLPVTALLVRCRLKLLAGIARPDSSRVAQFLFSFGLKLLAGIAQPDSTRVCMTGAFVGVVESFWEFLCNSCTKILQHLHNQILHRCIRSCQYVAIISPLIFPESHHDGCLAISYTPVSTRVVQILYEYCAGIAQAYSEKLHNPC